MTTGASLTFPGSQAQPPIKAPPAVRNISLSFQGVGFSSGKPRSFDAIAGANGVKVTGGYAVWNELERPYQDSLTMYQGRGAAALSVNIIFGSWLASGWMTDDSTGQQIENDISVLEWMGGQGFHSGPSPVVYMWSFSSQGGQTELIPAQYQGMPWIISNGIEWGEVWKNPNGFRVWQEATFTLKNYLNLSAPPPPDTNVQGGYYVTTPPRNTPLLIAGAPDVLSPLVDHSVLAGRICQDPKNNPCKGTNIRLNRKGVYYKIRSGVSVFVPGHVRN